MVVVHKVVSSLSQLAGLLFIWDLLRLGVCVTKNSVLSDTGDFLSDSHESSNLEQSERSRTVQRSRGPKVQNLHGPELSSLFVDH